MKCNQEILSDIFKNASIDDLIDIIKYFGDDHWWHPFYNENEARDNFNSIIQKLHDSINWDSKRNKEKGNLLEELTKFLFSRFTIKHSCCNLLNKDNEIDLNVTFNEILSPQFIKNLNLHFICECKNKASASVDVGMVSKLVEICETDKAGMGIFVSYKGISGYGWKHAEGKRRKLFLSKNIPIISFTVSELECFSTEGFNFYTEIKKKYQALVDELDFDGTPIKHVKKENPDFSKFLIETVDELRKIKIISEQEQADLKKRVFDKYGNN